MKSALTSSILLVAAAVSGVHAHARVNSPPIRTPGAQHLATCGQTSFDSVQNDPTGHIEEQQPVASDACELTLCRGMLFEDQPATNIQKVTPGQSMSMSIDCTIPHGGPANVSLIDTTGGGNGKFVGSFLASFDDFCPTSGSIPANQTNLQFELPDADTIGGACANDGDCVVQLFWATPDFSQNYYYCVDVTMDASSSNTTTSTESTTSTTSTEETTTSSSDSTIAVATSSSSDSTSTVETTTSTESITAATSTTTASDSTTTAASTTTTESAAATTSAASSSGCTTTVTMTVTCTVTASSSMTDTAAATSTASMSDATSSSVMSDATSSSSASDATSTTSVSGDVITAEVAQNVAVGSSDSAAGSASSTGAANLAASSTMYTGAAAGAALPTAVPNAVWAFFVVFVLMLQ